MDGMQQSPLMVQRIVSFQFTGDGTKRLHHNILPFRVITPLAIRKATGRRVSGNGGVGGEAVPSRCDHFTISNIRLRITNQYHSKHIHILRIEISQRSDFDFLFLTTCLTHIAHGCFRRTFLQEQLHETIQLPIASMRFRIIYRSHEITCCCSLDSTLNHFPRSHQVRQ